MEESSGTNTRDETIFVSEWLLDKLRRAESIALSRPSSTGSIYRVPNSLREVNEEAYTPQFVSIGPFHYGSQKLQSMEYHKLKYLWSFMERTGQIEKARVESIIEDSEERRVRGCYAEAIPFDTSTLKQIILVDAIFIIEFFLRVWTHTDLTADEFIEIKPWQLHGMKLDLILLENQLPFFIMEKLYMLVLRSGLSTYPSSFLELTFNFFKDLNTQNIRHDEIDSETVAHFVDLLRYFYLPRHPPTRPAERSFKVDHEMYSASQLAEAGLKFKPSSSGSSLVDIKFNEGVLEIPSFTLCNDVEIYARNLVALEQCHYPNEARITEYFKMLDFLINTGKDVVLLVQQGILVREQGTNYIRSSLSRGNLCAGVSNSYVTSDYCHLCRRLVDFRRKHWYVNYLKRRLKQDYFRTPWMGAATVGAIILLILTLIQTICTVTSLAYSSV